MELNNQNFSEIDLEKIKASIAELSYFFWVNYSDEDVHLYVRHFSQEGDLFEHTYYLIAGVDSWFSLAPGKAYFYYNNQPLDPIEITKQRVRYYIIVHKDGSVHIDFKKE